MARDRSLSSCNDKGGRETEGNKIKQMKKKNNYQNWLITKNSQRPDNASLL